MSEFSRAGSGPIASLARSYGITKCTPGDWELVSVPRLFSSSRDRLVNAGGRWETKQSRRAHCQQSVHEAAEAFTTSLKDRAPRISGDHRHLLAKELADVVDGVFTVQCMRELVKAEKRGFASFSQYAIEDFSLTGTASQPAVRSLLSLDFAGLSDGDDDDDEASFPGDQGLKASDFATPSRPGQPAAAFSQLAEAGSPPVARVEHKRPHLPLD